ncbi:lytic transglycosylase domain-containing protein (plasmid) [Sphingomonas paeninsulae]|uniref:Lytic transglycosylase domain-containing protein n=1 Tax=Sphingomonas paeninsulae TaxID=2319844 RepID=A0A494TDU6_SPHPE|nr:lytic transglycosylase domain-containing protein [Sphingomonas paeninsulae]AYJ85223.1 lytic transglycosylase domain-containing protein [Sphingomonas paeninsulae]
MVSTVANEARMARVQNAIAMASARTGVGFSYLVHQARLESSLNPDAQASTSSASGLYQFVEQSWLNIVAKHGADHGLGWATSAISRGSDGRYRVADPTTRNAILALRRNPEAASAMAAASASDNSAYLTQRLGHPVQQVDLYLAHFLGAAGAGKFLQAHDDNPSTPAATLFPAAARANHAVFYDRAGAMRSLGDIRQRFAARFEDETPAAPALSPRTAPVQWARADTQSIQSPMSAVAPQSARLAYLMLASLGIQA